VTYQPKALLIAGFSTRHVAASAHRSGYIVYAVDHFCDSDLCVYVKDAEIFLECADLPRTIALACQKWDIDGILVTSGAESITVDTTPVFGSSAECAAKFCDKQQIQDFFGEHDIPRPGQIDPASIEPGKQYILKPLQGAGGWRNRIVSSQDDIDEWVLEFQTSFILQEYVSGVPASACCVTTGKEARTIALNGQILRNDPLMPFGFCGSYTPFTHPCSEQMIRLAEKIALASGCIGVIGIDFIVGDEIWAIEINPRFQATLETVERATGINLVQTHIDACNGIISESIPLSPIYQKTSIRHILFANRHMTWPTSSEASNLGDDLIRFSDIPHPGTIFEPGDAVISMYGTGTDLKAAEQDLHTSITIVLQYVQ